jgi:hypothetical protein
MKTTTYQQPWLAPKDVASSEACRESVGRMVAAQGHRRALLLAGGDDGFWREDRIYQDASGCFWWQVDSHRSPGPIERPLPFGAAAELFALVHEAPVDSGKQEELVLLTDGELAVERRSARLRREIGARLRRLAGYP